MGGVRADVHTPRRSRSTGMSSSRSRFTALPTDFTLRGLSPRRRGNPPLDAGCRPICGSIPAQAGELHRWMRVVAPSAGLSPRRRGNSTAGCGLSPHLRVYPRAGGGTRANASPRRSSTGLSPRRRGNQVQREVRDRREGSIPAQAGEPRSGSPTRIPYRVYPRAGGGTVLPEKLDERLEGLSPRRRGNLCHGCYTGAGVGSIPAQAGEPYFPRSSTSDSRVYPRAGGGTRSRISLPARR